jgi:hypothetical protein
MTLFFNQDPIFILNFAIIIAIKNHPEKSGIDFSFLLCRKPAALRLPAEAAPPGNEGGCGCGDRGLRQEQAGEESLLDLLHRMAMPVLARLVDPATTQQIVGLIRGWGGKTITLYYPF